MKYILLCLLTIGCASEQKDKCMYINPKGECILGVDILWDTHIKMTEDEFYNSLDTGELK